MNTFKRKALFTAMVAAVGAAGTAEAVHLNPSGTGQVLVYPYYTAGHESFKASERNRATPPDRVSGLVSATKH